MYRTTAVLCTFLLTACAADGAPLQPEAGSPRASGSTYPSVIVANTIGSDGSLWMSTGSKSLNGTQLVWVDSQYISWEDHKGPSALSSGGSGAFYNGGDVQVFAIASDGSELWLGNVTADMSQDGHALDVPVGTSLKLVALTNPNCGFTHYRTSSGTISSPVAIISGGNVRAFFWCEV